MSIAIGQQLSMFNRFKSITTKGVNVDSTVRHINKASTINSIRIIIFGNKNYVTHFKVKNNYCTTVLRCDSDYVKLYVIIHKKIHKKYIVPLIIFKIFK